MILFILFYIISFEENFCGVIKYHLFIITLKFIGCSISLIYVIIILSIFSLFRQIDDVYTNNLLQMCFGLKVYSIIVY